MAPKCCYNIPFFGGFCAPTENPEPSPLRHVSNEYTLPAPCFRSAKCRRYWEVGMFCRAFGGVGCACADRRRGGIMLFAFAMSAVAWVFVLACSAATSTSPEIVLQTAWAAADVQATQGGATIRGTVYAGINLRVSQLEVTLADGEVLELTRVVPTNTGAGAACVTQMNISEWKAGDDAPWAVPAGANASSVGLHATDEQLALCAHCYEQAAEAVRSIVLSAITAVPTMLSDLQRATSFGDANCQKALGVITGTFSLLSGIVGLQAFARGCLRSLPNEVALTNGATLAANWRPGPGLVLLAVATLLKIVDIVCHIAVPTPAAKRDRAARDAKSLPDYLHMGDGPERSTSAAEMKGGAV